VVLTLDINIHEEIIEFLIIHQPYIKSQLDEFKQLKELRLKQVDPIFRQDVLDQYEARIKQWIGMYCSKELALPVEYIIIELEKIELEDYLNV
jgi:hypothetical protein